MVIENEMLTFKSSESNELIPLLDSLPIGEAADCCLSIGDRSVFDKETKLSKSMLRAIWKNKYGENNLVEKKISYLSLS